MAASVLSFRTAPDGEPQSATEVRSLIDDLQVLALLNPRALRIVARIARIYAASSQGFGSLHK